MRNVASEQMDDDELPLSSLRRKKMKKKRGSSPMRRTPSPMRRLPRRAVMRVYGLDGKLLEDDVTNIHNFLAAHTKDLPANVGFVFWEHILSGSKNKHSWTRYPKEAIMRRCCTRIRHKHS